MWSNGLDYMGEAPASVVGIQENNPDDRMSSGNYTGAFTETTAAS